MNARALVWMTGIALAAAVPAGAQYGSGTPCAIVNGTASIEPGVVDNDGTDESGNFAFSGQLVCASGPATSVCSTGTLANASCAMNDHAGSFVVCAGTCSAPLGGSPSCATGSPLASGSFAGSCLGAQCNNLADPGTDVRYALIFDAPTIVSALQNCSTDESCDGTAGDGCNAACCSITSATFNGPAVY